MKKKTGCFRSVLVIICVFVVAVIFRACTLKASAARTQLTLEQTLALYGTNIDATYYNSNSGSTYNFQFYFMGFSDNWTTLNQQQAGVKIGFKDPIYNNTGSQDWTIWAKNQPALIYFTHVADFNNEFVSSNTSNHANISLDMSINLTNLSGFQQYLWYSGWVDSTGAWSNPQNTYVNYRSTFSGEKKVYAMHNNAFQLFNRRYTYGIFPAYNRRVLNENTEFENALAYMYGIDTSLIAENSESFDITGADYTLNGCQLVDVSGIHYEETNSTYFGKTLVLLIGCPTLDGQYQGPTMPTTTPTTTVSTQLTGYTGETVSGSYTTGIGLDDISTDLAEIIRNQRWQIQQNDVMIQNGRRTNDNLSIIIEQLNRIYTNMLANGDISPELVQARQLDTIPPDIAGQIQTVLHGTWPTMPSNAFGDAPAVFGEMFDLFRDPVFSTIFYLGVVSLALSVAGWFLFKGRN